MGRMGERTYGPPYSPLIVLESGVTSHQTRTMARKLSAKPSTSGSNERSGMRSDAPFDVQYGVLTVGKAIDKQM